MDYCCPECEIEQLKEELLNTYRENARLRSHILWLELDEYIDDEGNIIN